MTIIKRLDFDTVLSLLSLPYEPKQKQLGIKINKAHDVITNFFHPSSSTTVKFEEAEIETLINLINTKLENSYNTIGDAGKLQYALNQLTL